MIYSDSRGQSEELHFIKEKQTKQNKKRATIAQLSRKEPRTESGKKKKWQTYETKLHGGHLGPHDRFLRKYNVIENRE